MDNGATLRGHIERIECGVGFIFLEGWVASPTSSRGTTPVTLRVEGVSTFVLSRFAFRDDLRDAKISDGNSGIFSLIRTDKTFTTTPLVYASIAGGHESILTSDSTILSPFKPRGAIDGYSGNDVTGWLFDPTLKSVPTIKVDGLVEFRISKRFHRGDLPFDHLTESGCGFKISKSEIKKVIISGGIATTAGYRHSAKLISNKDIVDTKPIEFEASNIGIPEGSGNTSIRDEKGPAVSGRDERAVKHKSSHLAVRIERVLRGKQHIAIVGWAAMATNEAIGTPLKFRFDTGEGVTVAALDYRADLAQKGVAEGRAAFTIILDVLRTKIPRRATVTVAGSDRSVLASIPNPVTSDASVISSVKGDERFIYGSFVDLNRTVSKTAILLVDDEYELEVPLSEEAIDKSYWGIEGRIQANFRVSTREVLQKLRGRNPQISFSANTKALISLGDARAAIALRGKSRGNLEKANPDQISGWLIHEGSDEIAEYDVYLDGVRYMTGKADRSRADLIKKNISKRGGGFRIDLNNYFAGTAVVDINVSPAFTKDFLSKDPKKISLEQGRIVQADNSFAIIKSAQKRNVSVIVPIYNAYDDLKLCLRSLVRHTQSIGEIILIDDRSPDPRIRKVLAEYEGVQGFRIFYNEQNMGFTRTVNRGIDLAVDNDVVLLNSDTIVTDGWLQGLRFAAYSASNIATATAVSNNSGVFSVPEMNVDNAFPQHFDVDDVARTVRQVSLGLYPRVPTGNGFCMFVRRDCIKQIGMLDEIAFPVGYGEENDFCMRALRAGFEHVCDDRTFVYHKRSASFGSSKSEHYARGRDTLRGRYPEYRNLTRVFETGSEMLAMRWHIRKAMADSAGALQRPKPRVAFVISTQTGGTPQTNRDLMSAIADRYEPWVIRCDSQKIEVYKFDGRIEELVSSITLRARITPAVHKSGEYDEECFRILKRYAFELVHIRHLGWHGLGLASVCKFLEIPVILSFHDFYAACPTIKLLDENQLYCGGVCTTSKGDCSVELWEQSLFPPLKHEFIHRWREMFAETFSFCDAFVTTSERARQVLMNIFPNELNRDFYVVPHGRTFDSASAQSILPSKSDRLRILVPGNISPAKGADLIRELLSQDTSRRMEFHILGDHGHLEPQDGLVLHGRYKRDEFGDRVREIKPHIGAVLSIWPETYCHTLTEMWSTGIPVFGIDLGAVGERIAAHGGGWLVSHDATTEQIFSCLVAIKNSASDMLDKINEVLAWQDGYGRIYNAKYMGMKYDSLYRRMKINHLSRSTDENDIFETAIVAPPQNPELLETIRTTFSNDHKSMRIYWNTSSHWEDLASEFISVDAAVIFAEVLKPGDGEKLASIAKSRNIELHVVVHDNSLFAEGGLFSVGEAAGSDLSVVRNAKSVLVRDGRMLDWATALNVNSKLLSSANPLA